MTAFEITKELLEVDEWTEIEVKKRHANLKQDILKILDV